MEIRWHAHRLMSLIGVLLLLALSGGVAYAQTPGPPEGGEEAAPYNEAEAHAIDRMIMCPVCPAETIDQAQVPLARQMRQTVRRMLAEGATREEILDFFAQRYGPDVLAAPPKSGFNLVAWVFPPVGVGAALVAVVLVLRSMSARKSESSAATPGATPPGEDLAPYLEMVDRELSLGQSPSGSEDSNTSDLDTGDVIPRREDGHNHG